VIANCPGVWSRSTRSLISVISSDALDLIDRHRGVERGDEPRRVDRRSRADRLVVERQDLAARSLGGRDLFEQCALADLAGSEQDDNASMFAEPPRQARGTTTTSPTDPPP
jgi:hypothetical protein